MLIRIEINNFALIRHAVIEAGRGFSVVTGETGAGKSLLIGAISAITGGRVSKELVRTGSDKAVVEAVFDEYKSLFDPALLAEYGLGEEELLILSREIEAGGRTRCRLNGRLVPLTVFTLFGHRLADIHGQNKNQQLFNAATHLELLDRFAAAEIDPVKALWTRSWQHFLDLKKQLSGFGLTPAERNRELELLRYQVAEIRALDLQVGEVKRLNRQRSFLAQAETIRASLEEALYLLGGSDEEDGAADRAGRAATLLGDLKEDLPGAADLYDTLLTCQDLLNDATGEVDGLLALAEADPDKLGKIDRRLDQIYNLQRKYGEDEEAVLAFAAEAEARLHELENSEAKLADLTKQLSLAKKELKRTGTDLTVVRQKAGEELAAAIGRELQELGMAGVTFAVSCEPAKVSAAGLDKMEFLASTNTGEPLKPLAQIASGGEAARIMLAIKIILARADRTPVLVFDEVDAGISGRTSELVGRKLAGLGRLTQVFCVTHTAQIAALADRHYLIEKKPVDGRTETEIEELEAGGRVAEVARLLSGDNAPEASRQLAEALLQEGAELS